MRERTDAVSFRRIFVGREAELLELRQGLSDALAGKGRLFLISGEPGVGKTRLAEELSSEALGRGARVMWGRCWAGDGAPAYWPWVQVVRSCLGDDSSRIEKLLKSAAPQVTELLPEISHMQRSSALAPRLHSLPSSNPEEARFRLFDSLALLLKSLADAEPLMILLDDLQEADQPSLLMLRFIARQLKEARLLLIGTYREAEVRGSPALRRLIGEISSEGHQLLLSGLRDSHVAYWLQLRGGPDVRPGLINALMRATGGNPLFVDGILRMLASKADGLNECRVSLPDLPLPDGIRETIRRRLSFLSKQANEILSIAAVIGQEFEFRCLQEIASAGASAVIEALNEARRDGLIHPVLAGGLSYRFAHDLIRETIFDDLPAARRVQVHWQIAPVLEQIYQGDLLAHLTEIAHHYRDSVTIGSPAKAIDYSIRAGEAALAVYAYDEARYQWQAALHLMNEYEQTSTRRAELLRQQGVLAFSTCDYDKGIEFLEDSVELSRRLCDRRLEGLAHLELGVAHSTPFTTRSDVPRALIHYRASETLLTPDRDLLAWGRLYLGRSQAALEALESNDGLAAADRGMEISHSGNNPGLWASLALLRALHLRMLGKIHEARSLLTQVEEIALQSSELRLIEGVGTFHLLMRYPIESKRLLMISLQAADLARADRALTSGYLVAVEVLLGNLGEAKKIARENSVNSYFRSWIAFREGDFVAARELILEQLNYSRMIGNTWNRWVILSTLIEVLRASSDYEQATATLTEALTLYGREQLYCDVRIRPHAALLALDLDEPPEAEKHVQRCRRILEHGEDWLGLTGAVDRAEAAVAAACGRLNDANLIFKRAVDAFRRYCLPWEVADTFRNWGGALLNAGEQASAIDKFEAAIEIYRRHGAGQRWIDRVADDRRRALNTATGSVDAERVAIPQPSYAFCKEGDYWLVRFGDKTARLKDAKGFHHLAYLLRHPDVEVPATYLAQSRGSISVPIESSTHGEISEPIRRDLGDAGPHLDARAKANYAQRINELRAELAEAESSNDAGRAQRARSEIEALAAQLKAATGLGGIDRRAASHRERARSTVSKRIRFAILQVQKSIPDLGDHLSKTIRTGYHCIYQPTETIGWRL